jgi:hypothetical protein
MQTGALSTEYVTQKRSGNKKIQWPEAQTRR